MDIVYKHPNGFFVEAREWHHSPDEWDSGPHISPDGTMLVWVEAYMDTRVVPVDRIVWTSESCPAIDVA